jgi:hypothetical protein
MLRPFNQSIALQARKYFLQPRQVSGLEIGLKYRA